MKLKFIISFLILTSSIFGFNDNSEWNDVSEIDQLSSENKKVRMIYFHAEWCMWCKKLEKEVFNDFEVNNYIEQHFLPFQADVESRNIIEYKSKYLTIKQLAELLNVKTFPTVVFINSSQEPIGVINGYYEKTDYMKGLEYLINDSN